MQKKDVGSSDAKLPPRHPSNKRNRLDHKRNQSTPFIQVDDSDCQQTWAPNVCRDSIRNLRQMGTKKSLPTDGTGLLSVSWKNKRRSLASADTSPQNQVSPDGTPPSFFRLEGMLRRK